MTETRRRGTELESAILDAAWAELIDRGYSGLSFDAVADRAQTSKPVLYRRWPTKEALLFATIAHLGIMRPTNPPDTGSLRSDVIVALQGANWLAGSVAGLFSTVLSSYFTETGVTPAAMRAMVFGDSRSGMQKVIQRAIDRGELAPEGLPARIATLPTDLFRHELLMTFAPVPDSVIIDIVDTVFMPLVQAHAKTPR